MILCLEEHRWAINESGEFRELQFYLQYHCRDLYGQGLGTYWKDLIVYWFTPECSRHWRRVLSIATGTLKCIPPSHHHSLTQLLSGLDFWNQAVEVLHNLSSFILQHAATPCNVPSILTPPQNSPATAVLDVGKAFESRCKAWSLIRPYI